LGAGSGLRARDEEPFADARAFVGVEVLLAITPRYGRGPVIPRIDAVPMRQRSRLTIVSRP
jgi:hypothetical protein